MYARGDGVGSSSKGDAQGPVDNGDNGQRARNLYCRVYVTHFRRRPLRMQGSDRVIQLA